MAGRKYRQSGYQDDEPRERGGRPGPGQPKEGPRGRGLGKPTATVCRCAVCGAEQEGAIAVASECRGCGADLHTCTHCVHFDASAPLQCRQPIAERVAAKAARNRCQRFEVRVTAERAADSDTATSGKAAFDALFKGL